MQTKIKLISQAEFQLVFDSIKAVFVSRSQNSLTESANFLAVAYGILASNELELLQMHAALKLQPSLLNDSGLIEDWTKEQNKHTNFVVHVLVYQKVLLNVEKNFDLEQLKTFRHPSRYHEWKRYFRKIFNLKINESSLGSSSEVFNEIILKRNALAFVDLFLSVLMPDEMNETDFRHYWSILASLAKRLWRGATIQALNSAKFLKIVINILQSCCKDLFLKLLLSWKEAKCNSCNTAKITNPVILQCEHCFCYKCIQHAAISRQCSACRKHFAEDYKLEVTKLSTEKKQEFDNFKQNCTSFFLQYLSTLCFPAVGEAKPDAIISDAVWHCLQNLVVAKKVTREMTPIDMESFDETPTVRSFILQLLLRYNRANTQALLENHFKEMEAVMSGKNQLMIIYIRCIEDLLEIDATKEKRAGFAYYKELILQIKIDYSECIDDSGQVKILNVVAAARYLMKKAAESVHELSFENEETRKQSSTFLFLRAVCDLHKNCDIPLAKAYFVKHLCRRFGFSDYQQFLSGNPILFSLVPSQLNPHVTETSSLKGSLYLLGEVFIQTQSRLLSVESEDNFAECIDELSSKASQSSDITVQILHAVQFWIDSAISDDGKKLRMQFMQEFVISINQYTNSYRNLLNFFDVSTEKNQLPLVASSSMPFILKEFVQVAGSSIAIAFQTILGDLNNIMNTPDLIASYYLPTMPQSSFFDEEVQAVVKAWKEPYSKGPPKPYLCPLGHIYYIGDCTNPNDKGTCPDCLKSIGGGGSGPSGLQDGNKAGELDESSQSGYLLGSPNDRPTAIIPERNCSKLDICAIRMFLHAAMIHASTTGGYVMRYGM